MGCGLSKSSRSKSKKRTVERSVLKNSNRGDKPVAKHDWKPFHSKKAILWCEEVAKREGVHIQHAENGGEHSIVWQKKDSRAVRIYFDGFCAKTNTVYEFHGDYWHGNPKLHPADEMNDVAHKTFGELYTKTKQRERYIRSQGYTLVVMWESDYDRSKKPKTGVKKSNAKR